MYIFANLLFVPLHEYQHDHECIYCRSDPPLLRLSCHHYEVIIIGTWYEFAHQSSPMSQHTLCESIVY